LLHTESSLAGAVSDESLLRHIVVNLLSNAVKYSEPGSQVGVTARREGPDLVLAVSDKGIGIPEADQPALFESFARASNVGTRPGTGLGLVVVRRSVEAHGGSVALASAPGEGTTVTVRLPAFRGV
jgi:signal transduction histidine kinase